MKMKIVNMGSKRYERLTDQGYKVEKDLHNQPKRLGKCRTLNNNKQVRLVK